MNLWPWHLSSTKSWPASGTTLRSGLARLIDDAAARGDTVRQNGAPGIRVSSSAFTGRAHVESIRADYTGSEVSFDAFVAARNEETPFPNADDDEIVARTGGLVDEIRLRADPLTVNGAEVRAELTAVSLPVDWIVVRHEGELYGTVRARRDSASRAAGNFRLSIAQDDLAAIIADAVRAALKSGATWTASLKDLKLRVTPNGDGRVVATIGARGKIFFVPLSGRLGIDASFSSDGVITIHRATAASRSLLSKLILLPLRAQLRRLAGRMHRIEGDALGVTGFAVDAAEGRLTVSGSLTGR
jgi:hypothetical protein